MTFVVNGNGLYTSIGNYLIAKLLKNILKTYVKLVMPKILQSYNTNKSECILTIIFLVFFARLNKLKISHVGTSTYVSILIKYRCIYYFTNGVYDPSKFDHHEQTTSWVMLRWLALWIVNLHTYHVPF